MLIKGKLAGGALAGERWNAGSDSTTDEVSVSRCVVGRQKEGQRLRMYVVVERASRDRNVEVRVAYMCV